MRRLLMPKTQNHVYFAVEGDKIVVVSVWGAPKERGPKPNTLASAQGGPQCLAIDGTSVYWTNLDGGSVMKAPLGGGPATVLASAQKGPYGIALEGANADWTNTYSDQVMKVSLSGGAATMLADGGDSPEGIAVDANSVYWVSAGSGSTGAVRKLAK